MPPLQVTHYITDNKLPFQKTFVNTFTRRYFKWNVPGYYSPNSKSACCISCTGSTGFRFFLLAVLWAFRSSGFPFFLLHFLRFFLGRSFGTATAQAGLITQSGGHIRLVWTRHIAPKLCFILSHLLISCLFLLFTFYTHDTPKFYITLPRLFCCKWQPYPLSPADAVLFFPTPRRSGFSSSYSMYQSTQRSKYFQREDEWHIQRGMSRRKSG